MHLLMNHKLSGVNEGYITRDKLMGDHLRHAQQALSTYIVGRGRRRRRASGRGNGFGRDCRRDAWVTQRSIPRRPTRVWACRWGHASAAPAVKIPARPMRRRSGPAPGQNGYGAMSSISFGAGIDRLSPNRP
jgi:hypothetical protein